MLLGTRVSLLGEMKLLVAPGHTSIGARALLGTRVSLLGEMKLLVAPGPTTRSKDATRNKGIATRSNEATSSSWPLVLGARTLLGTRASLLGAMKLLVAPGHWY